MTNIPEDVKKLVIARLEAMPSDKKMSIGSYGDFNKDQLIESVKKEDAVGKKIVEIEMEFLQALKGGIFSG